MPQSLHLVSFIALVYIRDLNGKVRIEEKMYCEAEFLWFEYLHSSVEEEFL